MNISDKLSRLRADRNKRAARVAEDRAAIAELDKKIKSLEALEIQNLMQELHLSQEEVKQLIRDMATTPTHAIHKEKESET